MASTHLEGTGDVNEIIAVIKEGVLSNGVSCELVGEATCSDSEGSTTMLVFEKYYYRSSNRASLSVMVSNKGENIFVALIGSGGGQGWLFKFSWGAEESFVNVVAKILLQRSYKVTFTTDKLIDYLN